MRPVIEELNDSSDVTVSLLTPPGPGIQPQVKGRPKLKKIPLTSLSTPDFSEVSVTIMSSEGNRFQRKRTQSQSIPVGEPFINLCHVIL